MVKLFLLLQPIQKHDNGIILDNKSIQKLNYNKHVNVFKNEHNKNNKLLAQHMRMRIWNVQEIVVFHVKSSKRNLKVPNLCQ